MTNTAWCCNGIRSDFLVQSFRGVLEDALGASVMYELTATDQAFHHGDLAPGTGAVGNIGQGGSGLIRLVVRHVRHDRHSV